MYYIINESQLLYVILHAKFDDKDNGSVSGISLVTSSILQKVIWVTSSTRKTYE